MPIAVEDLPAALERTVGFFRHAGVNVHGLADRLARAEYPPLASSEWLMRRIGEIMALPRGWDTYRAPPVSRPAARAARGALMSAIAQHGLTVDTLKSSNLGPSHDGGMTIEWSHAGKTLLVTFERDGRIIAARSDDASEEDRQISQDEFVDEVIWLLA